MILLQRVSDIQEMLQEYSLSPELETARQAQIKSIQRVLLGEDRRKLLIVGPCSADREDAVLEYTTRLADLKDNVADSFIIVPRIYTSKPRTNGLGYKGLLHRPNPRDGKDDLLQGLVASRRMHYRVISETGLFAADEMLYPDVFFYYMDLVCYATIGARSVENQQHRLVASGLDVPVGMKNPTGGDFKVMLNAIEASRHPQSIIYNGWVAETEGNAFSHAILRGYEDLAGISFSNYHYESIRKLHDMFRKNNIRNEGVIVDCNHSNSGKHYDEQIRIAKEVVRNCKEYKPVNQFVKGLMIESYLKDGNQMVGAGVYGKSITDPCLGWAGTERLIYELAHMMA